MDTKTTTTSRHSANSPKNSSAGSHELRPEALEDVVWEVMERHLPAICNEIARALRKRALASVARGPQLNVEVTQLPSAETLFRAAAQGGATALARELLLPKEQLIGIIGAMGLDPTRRVRRWKDEQRIRDYLIETIVARVERNRSFLGDNEP